ncbi:MAG: 5-formyltetrahydrofolate cyclo-ligase [Frankiales bacterium]|nr:5-formyltetrahydrofolate cyclo-ligase [Frankiales bacterium]
MTALLVGRALAVGMGTEPRQGAAASLSAVTTSHDPVDAKAALREIHLSRRRSRPVAERAVVAAAVTRALLPGLAGARVIAAYAPDDTEPGHGRLPAAYTQLGARILLPVVPSEGRELIWAVDTGRLAPGRFGLLEPVGPRLAVTAIGTADVVVVPSLAVARDGTRLGRGAGYYDRALRHVRPGTALVAVVFDEELVAELPSEPHDLRVTAVVTPSGGWEGLDSSETAMS